MKIYADVLHVPYMQNLAMAFPEHTFFTPDWTNLRELPPNVILGKLPKTTPVDVVIDSVPTFDNFDRPSSRRIKLFHMERGFNSSNDEQYIVESIRNSHVVVFVSEHKMWTFMDQAKSPTVVTIPFGLYAVTIGTPEPGKVGSVYLHMSDQQARVWSHVLKHFPEAELLGYGNPFPSFQPKTYHEFNARFERMDVFVHTVVGNSVGLSFAEAMMRAIPVVTGMNTDLPKELVSGWNCFIARGNAFDCLDEMVEMVWALIHDRTLRFKMGKAARDTARDIYGLDKFRKNWNHVFNNELGSIR